jgi:FkbM family methyltransferase
VHSLPASFIGGATDLADYYRLGVRAVVSTAIDRYMYVVVNQSKDDMLYSYFVKVVRFFAESGLGLGRCPLVLKLYAFLYQALIPQERVILVPVQEHQMCVDIGDMGDLTPALVSTGIYNKQMTKVVESVITREMVCLDIGANIGYFTLIMARLAGEKGKVFAFEPDPYSFDLLVKNITINGYHNVTPIQKAISNINGRATLFLDRTNQGSHSLARQGEDTHTFGKDTIEVETQTMGSFVSNYNGRIDFVKIDVEGAEPAVLEGMENMINQNKDLIIITEFLPDVIRRFDSSPEEYLNRLLNYGFSLYGIDEEKESVALMDIASLLKECSSGKLANILARR